jgi:hypothetical protein
MNIYLNIDYYIPWNSEILRYQALVFLSIKYFGQFQADFGFYHRRVVFKKKYYRVNLVQLPCPLFEGGQECTNY